MLFVTLAPMGSRKGSSDKSRLSAGRYNLEVRKPGLFAGSQASLAGGFAFLLVSESGKDWDGLLFGRCRNWQEE